MSYIGPKKIKETKDLEKTDNGVDVVEITYEDDSKEVLSKLMYDKVVSQETSDLTTLRVNRIRPIIGEVLTLLRNWGIKLSELAYFSAVLNESMQHNEAEATKELWRKFGVNLQALDEIDLINVDRVLRTIKKEPVISPYNGEESK